MTVSSERVLHAAPGRPRGRPVTECPLDPAQNHGRPEPHLTAANVMTAGEVAELLGVPISTVHHWARERTIPSRKIGRRRIFVRPKIEALLLSEDR
jgi:excisionase family DNA binding protein